MAKMYRVDVNTGIGKWMWVGDFKSVSETAKKLEMSPGKLSVAIESFTRGWNRVGEYRIAIIEE